MTCVHLRELYDVCQKHDLKLGAADLVRIVCPQCGVVDTCPTAHAAEVVGIDTPAGSGGPPPEESPQS